MMTEQMDVHTKQVTMTLASHQVWTLAQTELHYGRVLKILEENMAQHPYNLNVSQYEPSKIVFFSR